MYAGSQSMELTMSNILQRTDLYLQGDDIIWHPDNDGHRQAEELSKIDAKTPLEAISSGGAVLKLFHGNAIFQRSDGIFSFARSQRTGMGAEAHAWQRLVFHFWSLPHAS